MSSSHGRFTCISADQAAALIRAEQPVIFDVRDVADYRAGRFPGAVHLDSSRLSAWIGRLPKDSPILIYCYRGHASMSYAAMFADFRFTRLYSVDGGYAALAATMTPPSIDPDRSPA